MGFHSCSAIAAMPLIRPRLLIRTARIGARLYRRERDLPAAIAGSSLGAQGQIVSWLRKAELECEGLRRERSPAYRPGKHIQILSALIAEASMGAATATGRAADQTKASGSEALRLAM